MTNQLRQSQSELFAGSSIALLLPFLAVLLIFATSCGESSGDCVQVYEFEGSVVKSGYTRSECEEECATIGRTLSCTFEGRSQSPVALTEHYDFSL